MRDRKGSRGRRDQKLSLDGLDCHPPKRKLKKIGGIERARERGRESERARAKEREREINASTEIVL